jgi:hypothetical protein
MEGDDNITYHEMVTGGAQAAGVLALAASRSELW